MKPNKVARAVKARKAQRAAAAAKLAFSPYRNFTREEWARLRADTPMTLKPSELEQLSGVIEEPPSMTSSRFICRSRAC